MAFDVNEIYNILNSGTSAEDIAAEFTKNLNAAISRKDKEEKEKTDRIELAAGILKAVQAYVDALYPKYSKMIAEETPEALDKTISEAFRSIETFDRHLSVLERLLT